MPRSNRMENKTLKKIQNLFFTPKPGADAEVTLYTHWSVFIFSIRSWYIFYNANKENLPNNQKLLSW